MRLSRYLSSALLIVLLMPFVSCNLSLASPVLSMPGLLITIGNKINASSRSLAPGIDMTAASYSVTGTGPNSSSFTLATTGAPVTKSWLTTGSWTIVVNATNAGGDLIGTGTATVLVSTGMTTPVSISVLPIIGTGVLSLAVSWPSAQVLSPSIVASLTPALGGAQPLVFVIAGAAASYANPAIGTGYYTLSFTLFDNGVAVAGTADAIRIVAGQTTSGSYSYSNVNPALGSIQAAINADLENPLIVAIAGASSPLIHLSSLAMTASASNYGGSLNYAWYVNGASAGSLANYVFQTVSGPTKALGYYRVDVIALRPDGGQAGSATTNVQVTAAGPTAVSLGAAGNYALLAATGITLGASATVAGDVALDAGSGGLVGFGTLIMNGPNTSSASASVTGNVYDTDYAAPTPTTLTAAINGMTAAYLDAAGRMAPTATNQGGGELGGQTFPPGLYKWTTAAAITTDTTLDGGSGDVWIFQIAGALTMAASTTVHLVGGAKAKNVFWQTVGAVSIGANANFEGIALSGAAIDAGAGDVVNGRLLAQAAISLGAGTGVTQASP